MQHSITLNDLYDAIHPITKRYEFARALFIETSGLTVSSNLNQTLIEPLPTTRGVVVSILKNGLLYEASSIVHSRNDIQKTIEGLENTVKKSNQEGTLRLMAEERANICAGNFIEDTLSNKDKAIYAMKMAQAIKAQNAKVAMASARYRQINTHEMYVSAEKTLEQYLPRFEAVYAAVLKDTTTNATAQIYDG
ncbi:MAG TPA: hypothetical protein PLY93_07455, partial [Turneriella sp.]|nr:hypothetical protein [Turneriella sp.]